MKIGVSNTIPNIVTLPGQGGGGDGAFSTKSLLFDGTFDWVQSYPVYSALDSSADWAYSFWVKFSDLASNQNIFGISNGAGGGSAFVQCYWNAATSRLQMYFDGLSYYCRTDAALWTPVTGTWYHVLVTRDSAQPVGSKVTWFIDGNDCSLNESMTALPSTTATSGIYIGDNDGLSNNPMDGNIDEFAVYTQDMGAYKDEIYNGGTPNDLDNLATAPAPDLWYRMGENSTFKSPQILMPENTNKDKVSNYSLDFDGVTSYIDTSNATLVNGYTDVTFSYWVNVKTGAASWEGILCSRGGSDYILSHIHSVSGSTYRLYIQQQNGGGGTYTYTYTTSLNMDTWYHIAIMGSVGGKWDMYINGSNAAQVQGANTIGGITQSAIFQIGRDYGGRELVGAIDEVSIFDEVKAIGDLWDGTGKPTDLTGESGLVSWWRMGEDATYDAAASEWTIPDQAGSNNGTSANVDIYSRIGDTPGSPNNALSYNMVEADIVEDTPPNP